MFSGAPREQRPVWRRYLRFRGANVRADVDDEIDFHIQLVASSLIEAGKSPDDAWREARAEFGDVARATKECYRIGDRSRRRAERAELFAALAQDLRYAVRSLRATPLFALGVIAMLALAFAATTSMFGLVDALFVRAPALLADPGSVQRIYESGQRVLSPQTTHASLSFGRFVDLRAGTRAFAEVAAYAERDVVVANGNRARMADVIVATASLFRLYEVQPVLGRFWADGDEQPRSAPAPVAVLSYEFWHDSLAADSTAIGRLVSIGGRERRVIGVAPPGFTAFSRRAPAAFTPLTSQPLDISGANKDRPAMRYASEWLNVVVRRRAGVTDADAQADVDRAESASLKGEYAVADSALLSAIGGSDRRLVLAPLLRERGPLRTDQGRVVLWLGGFSLFVLAVAALNVTNLVRARLRRRQREIAIRLALGASLGRLLRLLFVEASLLTTSGAGGGIGVVALGGATASRVLLPNADLPAIAVGPRSLVFTLVLTLLVCTLIAVTAALRAYRWTIPSAIAESGHGNDGGRRRAHGLALAVQGALALSLCTTAGLFLKSLYNVRSLPLGYDPSGVVVVSPTSMSDPGARDQLFGALLHKLGERFGAKNVARSFSLPFSTMAKRNVRVAVGDSSVSAGENILYNAVSSSYFDVVRTRIVEGRGFTAADDSAGPRVAIVSHALARLLWPTRAAVGQCLIFNADEGCVRVVGISEDTRVWSLRGDPMLQIYAPSRQWVTGATASLLVRTSLAGGADAAAVESTINGMAPPDVVLRVSLMRDGLDRASGSWRIGASMLSLFAGLTLLVAALGVYATVSFDIAERERDLGVRIALGASRWMLVRGTLWTGARVGLVAALAGLSLSVVIGTMISASLFGVAGRDAVVYAGAVAVVFSAFLIASVYPALRSWEIDPALILRSG